MRGRRRRTHTRTLLFLRTVANRNGLRCPAQGIHPQDHTPAHPGTLKPIPLAQLLRTHAELICNPPTRIPFAHPLPHQPALGFAASPHTPHPSPAPRPH